MELSTVSNSGELANVLQQVENAIKQGTPQAAYPHFTPEGYKLFETLLSKTGTVSLVGESRIMNSYKPTRKFWHASAR